MAGLDYDPPLVEGRLVSRYQRFFADVELSGGRGVVTAHCPNPGSMQTCLEVGGRVWVQRKTGGKLDWGWELAELGGALVSVNPTRSNALVAAALAADAIPELAGYPKVRREADAGDSRLDFLLIKGAKNKERCFVEVKTVTMDGGGGGLAIFPDSVTERGVRHLEELRALRKQLADQENVPPYVIFSDASLRDMAHRKPRNRGEMLLVSGVGTKKYERYGEAFLAITKPANPKPLGSPLPSSRSQLSPRSSERYTPQWFCCHSRSGFVGCTRSLWTHWPTSGYFSGRKSAATFLLIDDRSISIWIYLERGENASRRPVTRSSKRAPRHRIRPAPCMARLAS